MTNTAARAILLVALLVLIPGSSRAADGTLLVANRLGSVSLFDLQTGVEIARVPVGPVFPHEIAVSPDGRWALAGEYGPDDRRGRRVVVIDIVAARVTGYIDVGSDSRPHDMRFLPDSRSAVVTLQDSDRIAIVDTQTLEVRRTYPTGGREGHLVQVSPSGDRAYVTSRGAEGTLSVIYLDDDRPPTVLHTGEGAEGIAVTADGGEVWVLNRRDASISIVDTESLEVVDVLASGPFPSRADASATGLVAVINGLTGEAVDGHLRIYDAASRRVLHDLPIPGEATNERGRGVLFSATGDTLWLSTQEDDAVLVYDVANPASPQRLTIGHDAPDGLAWSPLRVGVFEN